MTTHATPTEALANTRAYQAAARAEHALTAARAALAEAGIDAGDRPLAEVLREVLGRTRDPQADAEAVCHDEQMDVWASDFEGMLNLGGWLRGDMDYSDGVDLGEAIKRELRSIIGMAFSSRAAVRAAIARIGGAG